MSSPTTSISTVRRVIAVTLTILFATTLATPAAVGETGGDFGVCDDGLWQKADWNATTDRWDWTDGPGWDGDAPARPRVWVTQAGFMDTISGEIHDPYVAEWTSSGHVLKVSVKAATQFETFAGGDSGTVTGIDKTDDPDDGMYAISHIVFCYGPEPPPAPTGSLTVTKQVVGDYDGGDAFAFTGTCQLPQFPAHAQFSLADGQSWTFPEKIPGYLDGSPCAFEETDANGADSVTYRLGDTVLTPDGDGLVHFTLSSTEDLVLTVTNTFDEPVPEPEHVSVRITTMCEHDEDMVLRLRREDANTAVPLVASHVYKGGTELDIGHDWGVMLAPGETEYVRLDMATNPTDGLRVRTWASVDEVANDLRGTASRNHKPCGADVVLDKAWTDDGKFPSAGVQLTYTGPSFTWGFGTPPSITTGDAIGLGETIYLPFGETFDVTEDEGPWVNVSGLGTGLVLDAPTELADLVAHETITWTVTNTYVPEPPEVVLEKAWLADADADEPLAIHRKVDGEWIRVDDGDPFDLPSGFDLDVTYGEETYTVTETAAAGWEAVDCPAEAPEPNGLGTFPYEKPSDKPQLRTLDRIEVAQEVDTIRHVICNAPVPDEPEPLVPDIGLTKTPDVDTITYAPDDGDDEVVTYTYVVTNTGETALAGLTLVDDVLGTIDLAATDLAIGASTTGTATHVVTAADADAGQIVNQATVTGTAPDQTEVTATDDATVLVQEVAPTVEANPGISLTKTALVDPDQDGSKVVVFNSAAPEATVITYQYVITNSGETALTGITLVDDVLGTIDLPATDLAIGESMTLTATHTVTAADVDAGDVTNVATATGTDPEGTQVQATATETVLVGEVKAEVAAQDDDLPVTGANAVPLALAALLTLGTGIGLLRRTRSR